METSPENPLSNPSPAQNVSQTEDSPKTNSNPEDRTSSEVHQTSIECSTRKRKMSADTDNPQVTSDHSSMEPSLETPFSNPSLAQTEDSSKTNSNPEDRTSPEVHPTSRKCSTRKRKMIADTDNPQVTSDDVSMEPAQETPLSNLSQTEESPKTNSCPEDETSSEFQAILIGRGTKKLAQVSLDTLKLTKLPPNWTKNDVRQFFRDNTSEEVCCSINGIQMGNAQLPRKSAKVFFSTEAACLQARKELQNKKVSEKAQKILIFYGNKSAAKQKWCDQPKTPYIVKKRVSSPSPSYGSDERDAGPNNAASFSHKPLYNGNMFINSRILLHHDDDVDVEESYGLDKEMLRSMRIKPPLEPMIHVNNLPEASANEYALRRLFSYAGQVLSVSSWKARARSWRANILFDHPVEAVQAISMFNGRQLYGNIIDVQMDKFIRNSVADHNPPGLAEFGPGLCKNGLPLKNVRSTIELQKAVSMLMKTIEELKTEIRQMRDHSNSQTSQSYPTAYNSNDQNPLAVLATCLSNPATNPLVALSAMLNPQATKMLQMLSQTNTANSPAFGVTQTQMSEQPPAWGCNVAPPPPHQNMVYNQSIAQMYQEQVMAGPSILGQSIQSQINPVQHIQGQINPAQNIQGQINPGQNIQGQINLGHNIQGQINPGHNIQSQINPGHNFQSQINPGHNFQSQINPGNNIQGQINPGHNIQSQINPGHNIQGQINPGHNIQGQINPGQNMHSQITQAYNIQSQHMFMGNTQTHNLSQNTQAPNVSAQNKLDRNIQDPKKNQQSAPKTADPPKNTIVKLPQKYVQDKPKQNTLSNNCTVIFKYLPPSVTESALLSKMREVGALQSCDVTGAGQARVVFRAPKDARMCVDLLDGTKVDGQTITVRHA